MKFYPRLNMYKASNCSFDPSTMTALSYGWWPMLAAINGKLVRNIHNYSNSTLKHQSKLRSLLSSLGIQADIVLDVRADIRNADAVKAEIIQKWAAEHIRTLKARKHKANNQESNLAAARAMGISITSSELADAAGKLQTAQQENKPKKYPPLRPVVG
jgi:hypothetical protein